MPKTRSETRAEAALAKKLKQEPAEEGAYSLDGFEQELCGDDEVHLVHEIFQRAPLTFYKRSSVVWTPIRPLINTARTSSTLCKKRLLVRYPAVGELCQSGKLYTFIRPLHLLGDRSKAY
ncbi:hypothetical protein RvY_11201-1 [Ramazzottius varieornatus]|uniref:Uncharacterized protein n=1 Tax=Ramazzottius varieornatus TaxID=947166 RepID=A0A1D1VN34_RAMVA|nr:hypothetical protein RvY_11201-1 [Ramazzottius varieornatus]